MLEKHNKEEPLKTEKLSIVEGLARITKSDLKITLNAKEKAQVEKALREDEVTKKIDIRFGSLLGKNHRVSMLVFATVTKDQVSLLP